ARSYAPGDRVEDHDRLRRKGSEPQPQRRPLAPRRRGVGGVRATARKDGRRRRDFRGGNGCMTAVLLLLLALMPAIDLSAVTLPSLDAVRAEIARRAPIWQPQHGKTCKYHRSNRNNQPLGV